MKWMDRKGNVFVMVVLGMTFLMGSAAMVTDVGLAYAEKRHLSNSLDAAALAGAMELPDGGNATNVAAQYLSLNDVDPLDVQIIIDGNSIELIGQEEVGLYFARIFGREVALVGAKAKVVVGQLGMFTGIRPFGISYNAENEGEDNYGYEQGETVVLRLGVGDGTSGYYQYLGLGNGVSEIPEFALNGYDEPISIGDLIETQNGVAASIPNKLEKDVNDWPDNFDTTDWTDYVYDGLDPRVWIMPVVDFSNIVTDPENSNKKSVYVIGFALAYIDNFDKGTEEITCRFIKGYILDGTVDQSLALNTSGPYAMNLVANE